MTERLYYTDPYLREFDATLARDDAARGTHGARARSHGVLSDVRRPAVRRRALAMSASLDVVEATTGDSARRRSRAVDARGARPIDWTRRFDHMQQHTGQHVLSAAFDRLFGVGRKAFTWASSPRPSIWRASVTAAEIERAENESNRIVWEDRPVSIRFAGAAGGANARTAEGDGREGTIRLIDVDGLRSLRVRRYARRANRRHRHHCDLGNRAVPRRHRVAFLCGAAPSTDFARQRCRRRQRARAVRRASELPSAIERLQSDARGASSGRCEELTRSRSHPAGPMRSPLAPKWPGHGGSSRLRWTAGTRMD